MKRFGTVGRYNSNSLDNIITDHQADAPTLARMMLMAHNPKETVLRVFIHYQLTLHDVHIFPMSSFFHITIFHLLRLAPELQLENRSHCTGCDALNQRHIRQNHMWDHLSCVQLRQLSCTTEPVSLTVAKALLGQRFPMPSY